METPEPDVSLANQAKPELARLQIEQAHEYSMSIINAQLADRREQRAIEQYRFRLVFWLALMFVVLMFALFFTALLLNKEQIVIEALKLVGAALAGGVGGYGIKTAMSKNSGKDSDSNNN